MGAAKKSTRYVVVLDGVRFLTRARTWVRLRSLAEEFDSKSDATIAKNEVGPLVGFGSLAVEKQKAPR